MSRTKLPDKSAGVIDAVKAAPQAKVLKPSAKKQSSRPQKPRSLDMVVRRPQKPQKAAPVEELARLFKAPAEPLAAGTTSGEATYYDQTQAGFGAREFLLWFICIVLCIGIIWWLFGLSRGQSNLRTELNQSSGVEQSEKLKTLQQEVTDLYGRLDNLGTAATAAAITRLQSDVETLQSDVQAALQNGGTGGIPGPAGPQGIQGPAGPIGLTGAPGSSGTASCPNGDCLSLQGSTPGVAEAGNINITGVVIASGFQGVTLTVTTATVTANLTVGGNFVVSGTTNFGTKLEGRCDDLSGEWVWVPGSAKYGTLPGFCVMKYEAKAYHVANQTIDPVGTGITLADHIPLSSPEGSPWRSINQRNSRLAAQTACDGCHLITEPQWMTIAENVLWQPQNWSGGAVGTGCLFRGNVGNNDACGYNGDDPESGTGRDAKARLVLSNGEEIWDLSGNVWEWTDAYVRQNEQPSVTSIVNGSAAWREYTAIDQWKGLQYLQLPVDNWNASQGMGHIYSFSNTTDVGVRGFQRGGNWSDGTIAGVFTLHLNGAPTTSHINIGFRAAR